MLFLTVFILLQPLLDVLSYWLNSLGYGNGFTLDLRLYLLIALAFCGFLHSHKKRYYFILAGILMLLTLGHVYACLQTGYDSPIRDLTNLIRIYCLPISALAAASILKDSPKNQRKVLLCMAINLLVILAIMLLARATGTDPCTYPNKGLGVRGWFYNANAQSTILCMLVPAAMAVILDRIRKPLPRLLLCAIALGMLYAYATRLAFFGMVLCGLGMGLAELLRKGSRSTGIGLIAITLALTALLPISPMAENQSMVADNAVLKQQDIDEMVASDTAEAEELGLTGKDLTLYSLHSSYEKYLPGLVEHFGIDETAEAYDYSTLASDITDARRAKLVYSRMLLTDSPVSSKIFGLELACWDTSGETYDLENDIYAIYYLTGIAGLLLFVAFFLWMGIMILKRLIRGIRHINPETIALAIGFLCAMAHAWATAGILRRPNASIYLALYCALLYCWSGKSQSADLPETMSPTSLSTS